MKCSAKRAARMRYKRFYERREASRCPRRETTTSAPAAEAENNKNHAGGGGTGLILKR